MKDQINEKFSRTKIFQPISSSINSIWKNFIVQDNSPRMHILRHSFSTMNKILKARIN